MITTIRNPLTIIAIFSALAEGFATVALIQSPIEIQRIFIYFVMAFPTLIVILFFGVLIFKSKVLYAPSDFDNQEHFLEANQIRESVSHDIEVNLRSPDKSDLAFTEQQIQFVKQSINESIENVDPISRRNQIELLLRNGPATADEISRKLNLNKSYTYRLLGNLQAQNRVESESQEGTRELKWRTPF